MTAVLRFLFVIPIGFVAACGAAAFVLVWPFLGPLPPLAAHPLFWFHMAGGFGVLTVVVGAAAFVPWAIFMATSEIFGLRSILLHLAAGLAGAFGALRLVYEDAPPHASVQTAFVVAGLAFALIYWLAAGRDAGRWRRPKHETSAPV